MRRKANPLISVIVPAYNTQGRIEQCLQSILTQNYSHLEIIIIDDGSTDDTAAICKKYSRKDSRIKYLYQINRGVSNARNHGIKTACGDYITFVDADDTIEPGTIKFALHQVQKLSVDAIRYNTKYTNQKNKIMVGKLWELSNQVVYPDHIKDILWHFITPKQNIPCYTPTLLVKRAKIVKFREDISFMEDAEFYVRLLLNINGIFFSDKILYNYYHNSKSATKNTDFSQQTKNLTMAHKSLKLIRATLAEHQLLNSKNLTLGLETNMFITIHGRICTLRRLPHYQLHKITRKLYTAYLPPCINQDLLSRKQRILYFLIKHHLYHTYTFIVKVK